ncbi:MAG: hypothetical protein APF77_16105 [Clostridia bacterium BRH_c25]|nr:MAG: hypothetical protein APF77_16105 [Clostridia bacterium BRH_c25]
MGLSKLYYELARMYHEMYQSIFNYHEEFKLHDRIFKEYGCCKVLEVGCGSGNLAKYFVDANYDYIGTDLSANMLGIAKENNPDIQFLQRDMRELGFDENFDAVLITGRSFTYMLRNDDVNRCLESVNKALKDSGIFIFDNFNASELFSNFRSHIEQVSEYEGKTYKRVSDNSFNMETGWTWNWDAKYYIEENGKEIDVIEDKSILRAFTEDELKLFLRLHNFEVLKIINEGAAITIISQKK